MKLANGLYKLADGNLLLAIGCGEEYEFTNCNGLMVFHNTKPIGTASRHQLPKGDWKVDAFPESLRGIVTMRPDQKLIHLTTINLNNQAK